MAVYEINADQLKQMFLAGAANLEDKKEWINELNVFPVPDGDTGTNMTMTIMSAAKEVQKIPEVKMAFLAKAISSGSLRGARGNSGVILSQLFRGFCKYISDKETLNALDIAAAFTRASETAYKAVMKPKEGTILTVARGMTDKAKELAAEGTDLGPFFESIVAYGDEVLAQTPEMLPVLKQAGVVDSGGQGLMQVCKGAVDYFFGRASVEIPAYDKPAATSESHGHGAAYDAGEIKFGYCTEFIINTEREFTEDDELHFKSYLEGLGDCIVVVADDDIVKVHVHTNDPGLAIQKALTYGSLSRMKIDNMREEHNERIFEQGTTGEPTLVKKEESTGEKQEGTDASSSAPEEQNEPAVENKPFGFIVVSIGEGLNEIFRGLNVDVIIEGGQTMNPSTEDMLNAIDQVNADTIYIFPNNSNIILAAEQAMHMTEDKKIVVVPSRTVPQGITAILSFSPEASAEENLEAMKEAMKNVKTGQVTYAVRNTTVDDQEIHEGDIMGIGDHTILAVGSSVPAVTLDMLDKMVDEDSELISVYYGSDVPSEDAQSLADELTRKYPEQDVEIYEGGQPIYYYVLSVE